MAARLTAALWKHKPYWMKVEMSNRYVYAKVLRSHDGMPLVHVNTRDPQVAEGLASKSDKQAAAKVGEMLAIKAMELNIHGVGYQR